MNKMSKQNNIKLHMDSKSGLVYKDESHIVNKDAELARYLAHNNTLSNSRYYDYQKRIFDTFVSQFIQGKILDYGCGEEAPLKAISQLDMACYDLYFFKDEKVLKTTYDTIILIEVIEHFSQPNIMFKQLVDLLNPKGRLIIQTEFKPAFEVIHDWWYIRDETHLSFFDEKVFHYFADKNRIVLEKA